MTIVIPGVRNARDARTSDVITEQIALCKANLSSIDRIAFYRKDREKRDEVNRRLRSCHDFLGMAGARKNGCLYREAGLDPDASTVCEHAIPVTDLVSLYEDGMPFEVLVFYPVARISKASDRRLQEQGLVKSGHERNLPFLRYYKAGIAIETHEGRAIDCDTWTIENHWDLVGATRELSAIRQEVLEKLRNQCRSDS